MRQRMVGILSPLGGLILAATTLLASAPAASGSTTPPPENLQISDLGANHVTMTWDSPDGSHDYFELYEGPEWVQVTSRKVMDNGATLFLEQDTTYRFRVRGYVPDLGGPSEFNEPVEFTTPVDETDPAPVPRNLRVDVDEEDFEATVRWDPPVSDPRHLSYTVMFREGCCGPQYERTDGTSMTFPVRPNHDYTVSVRARDSAGRRSANSGPLEFSGPDVAPPTTPQNVEVTTSPGEVAVEWDASSSEVGVADYEVRLLDAPGGTRTVSTEDTTAEFTVPPGGELAVIVRARDVFNRWSDDSERVDFTLDPDEDWEPVEAPGNLRAVFDGDEVERLAWDAASGGTGSFSYSVEYKFPTDTSPFPMTRVTDTFATPAQIGMGRMISCDSSEARTELTWSITAISAGVRSEPSNEVSVCFEW